MKKISLFRTLMFFCFLLCYTALFAQESLIPATAISNIPTVSFRELNLNRNDFSILKTISTTAVVNTDNKRTKRTISEANGEFTIIYKRIKHDGKRFLEYDECEGIIRLGFLGSTNIYTSDSDYLPAEEIVRRLALYRLISIAKEYGADALFEPTITTTATSTKKTITYKTEASAKLIKITNN